MIASLVDYKTPEISDVTDSQNLLLSNDGHLRAKQFKENYDMKNNSMLSVTGLVLAGLIIFSPAVLTKETKKKGSAAADQKAMANKEGSPELSNFAFELKSAVKNGEISKEEATAKYRNALAGGTIESLEKNQEDESLLTLNGFFLGGKEDEDGQYQASFIIQSKAKNKSEWPRITFSGKRFESQFSDLEKRDVVVINLGEGTAQKMITGRKGKKKGKSVAMRKSGGKGGLANFYSIVIGRLKSKDIELGEFTMEVDYATLNRYSSAWVKDEIMGKTVKVAGVSGQFRDNLLLIKPGQTLKVRTSGYSSPAKTLAFAHKFNVLERALPFNPDAHGVPPESFRGFQGVLQGKIVEAGGYEVLLRAEDIVKVGGGNEASDANSIKGKLVRISGFYDDHADKFNGLQQSDIIRVGIRHTNRVFDMFGVTDILELVEP